MYLTAKQILPKLLNRLDNFNMPKLHTFERMDVRPTLTIEKHLFYKKSIIQLVAN